MNNKPNVILYKEQIFKVGQNTFRDCAGENKVLEKCSFAKEWQFREDKFYTEKCIDTAIYSILSRSIPSKSCKSKPLSYLN